MREVLPAELVLGLVSVCQPGKMCALQWFVAIMEKQQDGSAGNDTNLPSPRQPAQH